MLKLTPCCRYLSFRLVRNPSSSSFFQAFLRKGSRRAPLAGMTCKQTKNPQDLKGPEDHNAVILFISFFLLGKTAQMLRVIFSGRSSGLGSSYLPAFPVNITSGIWAFVPLTAAGPLPVWLRSPASRDSLLSRGDFRSKTSRRLKLTFQLSYILLRAGLSMLPPGKPGAKKNTHRDDLHEHREGHQVMR